MGKRGPKPTEIGILTFWEFEFYKAFHSLRDGTPLPIRRKSAVDLPAAEIRRFIERLKQMNPEAYWLTTRRVALELGEKLDLRKPPTSMDRFWAAQERKQEIFWLERGLHPPKIEAQIKRRKIWNDLVRASTYSAVRRSCGRWARLPDVRRAGMTPFAGHVVQNAAQFLLMKKNKRFPRSEYSDNARLEYLARGMAGILEGVSPMTAIERLRNMKHGPQGALWRPDDGRCGCWRCSLRQGDEVEQIMQGSYENGLRLFVELAATTRVPRDWLRGKRSRSRTLDFLVLNL